MALVTGAACGLGLETARQFGLLGAVVLVSARDAAKATAAAGELRAAGCEAHGLKLDVTSEADREAAYHHIQSRHGVLDILINNAAVWLEIPSASSPPLPEGTSVLSIDILRQTFEANFFAPVQLTQKLLPLIRKSVAGRIVNVSSIMGSLTLHCDPASSINGYKVFAYDASKTALNAFTVHLVHELRDTSIKVNSIHSGWVRSEMGGADALLDTADGAAPPSGWLAWLKTVPPAASSSRTGYCLGEGRERVQSRSLRSGLGRNRPEDLVGDFLQRAAADTCATDMAIFVTWSHVDPSRH